MHADHTTLQTAGLVLIGAYSLVMLWKNLRFYAWNVERMGANGVPYPQIVLPAGFVIQFLGSVSVDDRLPGRYRPGAVADIYRRGDGDLPSVLAHGRPDPAQLPHAARPQQCRFDRRAAVDLLSLSQGALTDIGPVTIMRPALRED